MSAPPPSLVARVQAALAGRRGAIALALIAAVVAALLLLPGLGEHGIWAEGETMVLDRSRAALGVALADLERAPGLPDAIRTAALEAIDRPEAIRLPGALAMVALVGLTTLVAAARGVGALGALVAGAFALAFPLTLAQGRLALGAPIGELLATAAALAGHLALHRRGVRAIVAAIAAAGLLALAIASSGLVLGGLIPLVAIAVGRPAAPRDPATRWIVRGLWLAIVGVAGGATYLALGQGDGYIPLLGAARDLDLVDTPHLRGFTASLEELGYQLFPWLPLALVGVLRPGPMRWPALWLLGGLGVTSIWSLIYGPGPIPLTLPAALTCTAGLLHLADPKTHRPLRRLALLLAIGGILVTGKDAKRIPAKIATILAPPVNEGALPAETIGADTLLPRLADLAILAVVIAGIAGGRRIARPWLAPGTALIVLLYQSLAIGHQLIPQISARRSLKGTFTRLGAWTRAGALPAELAVGRIRDPGLDLYGPPVAARRGAVTTLELTRWLKRPEASVALIRRGDLPALFAAHRQGEWPLHVLDESHGAFLLVSNTLPAGAVDQDPLLAIVSDAPPTLARETMVRFEDYLEIVGWEVTQPLIRGQEAELRVAIRVLRALPSGAQLYFRLQRGKLSRINPMPHNFADGLYPVNLWRPGDFVDHRFRFKVPLIEILSGSHEVIVGVKASASKNLAITEPSEERGAYGVVVKGGKRDFATIGEVTVW
ncbi:MAG: hypothetical protein H6711_25405 [Myxococcales bacterium]|nr:hypothetical protein [Myxococcales bacterium]